MMNVNDKEKLEQVGPAFTEADILLVREKTFSIIQQIIEQCHPGMLEEDAVEMAQDILAEHKMLRGWHDVYVRFGKNTTKTYGMDSDPGVVLGENDIMFVDIGPVFEKWEGDGGDSFVFGSDPEMHRCAADARKLFHSVRDKWERDQCSGQELYNFAEKEAESLGWVLNLDWSGHRIADFPHAVIYNGLMSDIEFCPSSMLWVLEIHIKHPTKPYGAFFEDLLMSK